MTVEVRFRDAATMEAGRRVVQDYFADLSTVEAPDGVEFKMVASIKPVAARALQDQAIKQNITTLHNRINELGVAEPVIRAILPSLKKYGNFRQRYFRVSPRKFKVFKTDRRYMGGTFNCRNGRNYKDFFETS